MKKLSSFLLAGAVAVLSIASCSDKISADDESLYTYRFTLSTPSTKAVLDSDETATFTKWESGDRLGVYTLNNDAEISYNRYADIDVSKDPVEFSISSYNALTAGSEVYTYFPYDSSNSTGDAQDPSKVRLSIPVSQTGKMNDMPMVGVPYIMTESVAAKTDTPIADINLYNLGGIFQFNIFSTNEEYRSETVKSVAFNADSEIAGSFTFDITQVKDLTITGNTEKSIKVAVSGNPSADKASALQANMVVKPGTYTGTVVVTTDAATYTYTLTSGKTVDRSHIKPLNVDLAEGVRAEVEESKTAALEKSEIVNLGVLKYKTEKQYVDGDITWTIYGYKDNASRPYVQLKKDSGVYVKISAPSPITKVSLTITSTTNTKGGIEDITKHTAYSGTVRLKSADAIGDNSTNDVVASSTVTDNTMTLIPTGSDKELYVKVSIGARIWGIEVEY